MKTPLLEIRDPQKDYPIYDPLGKLPPPKTYMRTVSDTSLDLYEGKTYGLVGESGYGESTTRRSMLGPVGPDRGEILYRGHDLTQLSNDELRPLRWDLQMVFQDTLPSLNLRSRIGALLEKLLIVQGMGDTKGRRQKVLETLERVGLSENYCFRYPHELPGGQVQHLGITRALTIGPKLIICDEPVSALDVPIQSQTPNMLTSL